MFPVVAIASNTWIWLLMAGVLLNALNLITIAILIYAVAVLFHIVTLPVESTPPSGPASSSGRSTS